jgi:hypothetical protein
MSKQFFCSSFSLYIISRLEEYMYTLRYIFARLVGTRVVMGFEF